MNPEAHADIAVLAERLDTVEAREESTRTRLENHLGEERTDRALLVEAITAIRMDVHALRAGKRVIIGLVVFFGAAMVAATSWTVKQMFRDYLIDNHVVEIRRIQ